MKKALLLLTVFSASFLAVNAADKVWDMADYPAGAGTNGATTSITTWNSLTIYPCAPDAKTQIVNFGELTTSSQTFSDNYSGTVYFKTNGGASVSEGLPTQRYFSFDVTAASTITVWYRAGGSSARTVDITHGTTSLVSNSTSASVNQIVTVTSTGAGTIYIYGSGSQYIYKISATNVSGATAIADVQTDKVIASVKYYDLTGKEVSAETKGFIITKTTYEDGSVDTTKSIVR